MRPLTLLFVIPVLLAGCTSTSAEAERRSVQVQYPVQRYLEEIAANVASARSHQVDWDGSAGVHATAHERAPAEPAYPTSVHVATPSVSHSATATYGPTQPPRAPGVRYQPAPPHPSSRTATRPTYVPPRTTHTSPTPLPPTTFGSVPSTPPSRTYVPLDGPRGGTGLARRRTTYDKSRNAKYRD